MEEAIRLLVHRNFEIISTKIIATRGETHADMKSKHLT